MIWFALPCTAWSSWQNVNKYASEATWNQIQEARKESLALVEQARRALGTLHSRGVPVWTAFEWPKAAVGWKVESVQRLLQNMRYQCEFDGCCYGLTTRDGSPVRKP